MLVQHFNRFLEHCLHLHQSLFRLILHISIDDGRLRKFRPMSRIKLDLILIKPNLKIETLQHLLLENVTDHILRKLSLGLIHRRIEMLHKGIHILLVLPKQHLILPHNRGEQVDIPDNILLIGGNIEHHNLGEEPNEQVFQYGFYLHHPGSHLFIASLEEG